MNAELEQHRAITSGLAEETGSGNFRRRMK